MRPSCLSLGSFQFDIVPNLQAGPTGRTATRCDFLLNGRSNDRAHRAGNRLVDVNCLALRRHTDGVRHFYRQEETPVKRS